MFPIHKQDKTINVELLEFGHDDGYPDRIFLRDDAGGRVAYARTDINRDNAWHKSKEKAWLATQHLELAERLLIAGHYIEAHPLVQTALDLCRASLARAAKDHGQG